MFNQNKSLTREVQLVNTADLNLSIIEPLTEVKVSWLVPLHLLYGHVRKGFLLVPSCLCLPYSLTACLSMRPPMSPSCAFYFPVIACSC